MSPNDFKKLKEDWYKKLETDGFKDIEKNEHNEYNVKRPCSKIFKEKRQFFQTGAWQGRQEHYQQVSEFLNTYTFNSELDKTIWTYHAEGLTLRNIADLLKKAGVKRQGRDAINDKIRYYEAIMKKMLWASAPNETNEQ